MGTIMSQKWKEKDLQSGLIVWGKNGENQSDFYACYDGDGAVHCHMFWDKRKNRKEVIHRGTCAVCRDKKGYPFDNEDKR